MDESTSAFQGFLHKTEAGQWLLCDAPDLKSCCLKKHTLVILEGDFSRYSPETAVTVQGIYNPDDRMLSSVTVEARNSSFPYWSLGAIVMIICLWILIKSLKGRPLPL